MNRRDFFSTAAAATSFSLLVCVDEASAHDADRSRDEIRHELARLRPRPIFSRPRTSGTWRL